MVPTEEAFSSFMSGILTKLNLRHNIHREILYLRRILKMMRR